MVLIFGAGDQSQDLGEVAPLVCPNCHNEVFLHHVRTQRRFSLYFVPVATMSTNEYLVCPICSHGLGVPAAQVAAVGAMAAGTAAYRRGAVSASIYGAEVAGFWPKMGLRPGPSRTAVGSANAAPAPGPGATAPTAAEPSLSARLAELGRLHRAGILTDAEFAAAKARLLGG